MKHSSSLLLYLLCVAPFAPLSAATQITSTIIDVRQEITAHTWFRYAQDDLRAAQILSSVEQPLFGVALYHIEQAAEKALKAYLVFTNQKFALIHDLPPLLESCQKADQNFNQFQTDMKEITPYATKSRYPNKHYVTPDASYVYALLSKAQLFLNFVHTKIC